MLIAWPVKRIDFFISIHIYSETDANRYCLSLILLFFKKGSIIFTFIPLGTAYKYCSLLQITLYRFQSAL